MVGGAGTWEKVESFDRIVKNGECLLARMNEATCPLEKRRLAAKLLEIKKAEKKFFSFQLGGPQD
ncbi:hypothetical protein C0583_03005 [Candidatus Parcubacteria bacterium]|nr:MAG: hypothetical protein C0583_03005 [Candidatus Parcubacteria bacterium]